MGVVIVLDGPIGTELEALGEAGEAGESEVRGAGAPPRPWSAVALDRAPDRVTAIHAAYLAAGATVHRTNTFRTQPHVLPASWRALLTRAVACAAEGAKRPHTRVAGSIGPVADCYHPERFPGDAIARPIHRAVAEALAAEGVDLLVCETFANPEEARLVVEVATGTGLPTWLALTAGPHATLAAPEAIRTIAARALDQGAEAVLVNCTAPFATAAYVAELARLGAPCGAYANAGTGADGLGYGRRDAEGAERYADLAEGWARAGATIVGACCGLGPVHVAAVAARFIK